MKNTGASLLAKTFLGLSNWLGVVICLFFVLKGTGGDPSFAQADRYATPERIESLRKEMGLNRSLWQQLQDHTSQTLMGQWGSSWNRQTPVASLLRDSLPPTLLLTLPPFCMAWILTLLFLSWRFRGKSDDSAKWDLLPAYLLLSVSSVVWILGLQYILAYRWGLFPIRGWESGWPNPLPYLAIPWMILLLSLIAPLYVIARNLIQQQMTEDYVRSARAKGLSSSKIFWGHILPNSAAPLFSLMALQVPYLVTGSFLLESFFSIPGWGSLIVESLQKADHPVLIAMTTCLSLPVIVLQLIADHLGQRVDPRLRLVDRSSL